MIPSPPQQPQRQVAVVILLALLGACEKDDSQTPVQAKPLAFPVKVDVVASEPANVTLGAVGNLEAFEEVPIVARVGGAIDNLHFMEGHRVARGEILVTIEPERYALAVQAAQASRGRTAAALQEARTALRRRKSAGGRALAVIGGEELAQHATRVQSLQSELHERDIAVRQAQLDARNAAVRAPRAGVVQARQARTGQYVQPGTTLATLMRRDPLLLRFDVPEGEAWRLRPNMQIHFNLPNAEADFDASIVHVAGAANASTRTAAVVARVADTGHPALRPGAFARVAVPLAVAADNPVIEQAAVRASDKGFIAYVVEGQQAKERQLRLGLRTKDGRVEVRAGLRVGELLVTRGSAALKDGAHVAVVRTPEDDGAQPTEP